MWILIITIVVIILVIIIGTMSSKRISPEFLGLFRFSILRSRCSTQTLKRTSISQQPNYVFHLRFLSLISAQTMTVDDPLFFFK